jgi:hypothetical protein
VNPYPAPPAVARVLRAAIALAVIAAIVATVVDVGSRTTLRFFDFFGYFTVQSNLLLAAGYLYVALTPAPRTPRAAEIRSLVRACLATYIGLVGLVYLTLLAPLGEAGGVPVRWANTVLHIVTPIYGLFDWIVFRDRLPLPFRRVWVVLIYPAVWLTVVLIRGATDGWVPYPFLDPADGYAAVAGVSVGILVVLVLFGLLMFWISRLGARATVRPA